MLWQRETFKKIKQVPREEHVLPGTTLCAGCGWPRKCWVTMSCT